MKCVKGNVEKYISDMFTRGKKNKFSFLQERILIIINGTDSNWYVRRKKVDSLRKQPILVNYEAVELNDFAFGPLSFSCSSIH